MQSGDPLDRVDWRWRGCPPPASHTTGRAVSASGGVMSRQASIEGETRTTVLPSAWCNSGWAAAPQAPRQRRHAQCFYRKTPTHAGSLPSFSAVPFNGGPSAPDWPPFIQLDSAYAGHSRATPWSASRVLPTPTGDLTKRKGPARAPAGGLGQPKLVVERWMATRGRQRTRGPPHFGAFYPAVYCRAPEFVLEKQSHRDYTSGTIRRSGGIPRRPIEEPLCHHLPVWSRSPGWSVWLSWSAFDSTTRMQWNSGLASRSVEARGPVTFTDDDRDVKSLAPGGYILIEEGTWLRTERSYEVRADSNGSLSRTFRVAGRAQPMDADAQAWAAGILLTVIRESGVSADLRVERLLRKGGPAAVLREVSEIHSDGSRRSYLRELVERGRLNDEQLRDAIRSAKRSGRTATRRNC